MALYSHKLSKLGYHNWVKATLAVLLTKEGIEPSVYKEIQEFQFKCLDDVCYDNGLISGATCSRCCTENVVTCRTNKICYVQQGRCSYHLDATTQYNSGGCPSKICHHFKDKIQQSHRHNGPSYKNTDATQWCSNPWEIAKCFMPPDGYKDVKSPAETDFNGINSVIINYKGFQAKIQNLKIFETARRIGRDVRHSPNLEIDATDLQQYFTDLNILLSDPGYLANDINAQEAKKKLLQLQRDILPLGEVYIRKVLDEAAETIKENIKKESDDCIRQQKEQYLELLETSKKKIGTLFEINKIHEFSKIKNNLSLAVDEIERKKKEVLVEINTFGDKQVKKVEEVARKSYDENEKAKSEIRNVRDEHVKEVENTKSKALEEVERKTYAETEKAKSEIRNVRDEHVKKVEEMKLKALEEIERKTYDETEKAKSEICNVRDEHVKKVEETKSKALEEIEEKAKSEIRNVRDERVKSLERSPDEIYANTLENLQHDLISFYRDEHRTISLSPLIEEKTPLLKFYVIPDIYSLKLQRTLSGVKQQKTAVTPLRNVFYKNNKMCRKIYLTADAGLGKTALSKRLTLAWCNANKPHKGEEKHFSQEEIQAVNGFRLVFLLLLRNCSSECCMDNLIMNQIIFQLAHNYTLEDLVNILCKEQCLVILDGLDEWSHPKNSCKQELGPIPHQKARDRTAVLTTTRPWKLSVCALKSSQIDQKLELMGLNSKSANALKKSAISHLFNEKNENKLQDMVKEFTGALEEKQIAALEAIPLLLMYLLLLWYYKIELGQSHCDLYSDITELLLSRTEQKTEGSLKVDPPLKDDIPLCLGKKRYCTQFYTLLTALGQLAYQTLFRETIDENTLVFDGSVAEQYLNKECMNFCLQTGLITQSKVPGTLLEQKSKVSFAHKTVQEFVAALYMHSISDQTSVPDIVLSKCKCIKDILEISNILKFSCGMNVNVSYLISREMMKIINGDEIIRKYRRSLENSTSEYNFSHPLKDFQDMCISCCKEIPSEHEFSLCLQDVFIDGSCKQEQYRENLKQLTTKNKQNIRSLYIYMYGMCDTPYSSVQKVNKYFALNDMENIEKIHYKGEYNDCDILPLLHRSVRCLYLSCSRVGLWSCRLFEKVTSLQELDAIHVSGFKMSHIDLKLLYDYISQRYCMRQIVLEELLCADHGVSCTGYSLNLSGHSQLSKLTLGYSAVTDSIPVSELNINMTLLEECHLIFLSNPDLVLQMKMCVQADSKLNTFVCYGLESTAAIETMLETLHLSVHVKHVDLRRINLGEREVLTSEMVNIECVVLLGVKMSALVLQRIVDVLQQQPRTVTVYIGHSDIEPESEFETVKQKNKTSREHFRVHEDSGPWVGKVFQFETIKG